MNFLSWMIYLGDVSGSLNDFFAFIGFFSCFIAVGLIIFGAVCRLDDPDNEKQVAVGESFHKWAKILIIPFVVGAITASLIPQKTTFYLIAASEITESVVVDDPEIQKMLSLAKKRIISYLEEEDKEKFEPKEKDE